MLSTWIVTSGKQLLIISRSLISIFGSHDKLTFKLTLFSEFQCQKKHFGLQWDVSKWLRFDLHQKRFEHHQIRSLKNRKWSPHVILKIQSKHLCWSGIAETSPWNADTWPQRIDGFGLVQLGQATSKKQFSCILQRKCIPAGKDPWRNSHVSVKKMAP